MFGRISFEFEDFTEKLICKPLPGALSKGLGEKSATIPFLSTIALTTEQKVKALSAASKGEEYLKSISF